MPFTLIKGSFHVLNYSPDGDSIRFQPDNRDLVLGLAGPPARFNARGHVQLRIEGIDALETHYSLASGGSILHQPRALAQAATDRLLSFVGITHVEWDVAHNTVISAKDGVRGYILSRALEKNRRPVAFVYAGDSPQQDGEAIRLDRIRLRDSYNYAALAEGMAYPTYYRGLFHDLRDELTSAVKSARNQKLGIHAIDRTTEGVKASGLGAIVDQNAILPKLFRRLAEYMVHFGTATGFKKKMEQSAEPVLDLRSANFTHFDTFLEQERDSVNIRLTRQPEELVFDEMVARPSNAFSLLMETDLEGRNDRRMLPVTEEIAET